MEDNRVGKNLRRIREKRNISVNEISTTLSQEGYKASIKTIYSWESGNSQPNPKAFLFLCDYYQVTDILSEFGFRRFSQMPENINKSPIEQSLVKKYRQLDSPGKKHVDYTVDRELECTRALAIEEVELHDVAAHSDGPLTEGDIQTATRFLKEKKLERMKNET